MFVGRKETVTVRGDPGEVIEQQAKTARDAAAAADAASARAQQSATHAQFSASRAAASAIDAQKSADTAREAARQAGLEADAADAAAKEAFTTAVEKYKAQQRAARSLYDDQGNFKPPCHPGMNPLLQGPCRQNDPLLRHLDEGTGICEDAWGSEQVCDQIQAYQKHQDQQANNRGQMWLAICGFAPLIGEPCDYADMIIAAAQGDWQGAATSGSAMIPFIGWAAGSKRMIDLVREGKKLERKFCKNNSFTRGTPVLLANGTTEPIQHIRIGHVVLATDPTTPCDPELSIDNGQFGAKWGRHARDFGLDPADANARAAFLDRVRSTYANPSEVRVGPWNPSRGGDTNYRFSRSGNMIVLTKSDGSFVTTLNSDLGNGWWDRATVVKRP